MTVNNNTKLPSEKLKKKLQFTKYVNKGEKVLWNIQKEIRVFYFLPLILWAFPQKFKIFDGKQSSL